MEFVKFLCIAVIVIAQAHAAPAGGQPSKTEFVLPEVARNGFEMTVEAAIADKFKEELKDKALTFLWDSPSELCESENDDGILCVVPSEKPGNKTIPDTFQILIKARMHHTDGLVFKVWLNGNYVKEFTSTFEDFKNVSIKGVVADIQTLHLDFMHTS